MDLMELVPKEFLEPVGYEKMSMVKDSTSSSQAEMPAKPIGHKAEDDRSKTEIKAHTDKEDGIACCDVMINVHVVRHYFEYEKRNKTQLRLSKDGLKSTAMVVLAIGNEDQLWNPRNFFYRDPLFSWRSASEFVNSPSIRTAINNRWRTLDKNHTVAQHIVLVGSQLDDLKEERVEPDYNGFIKIRHDHLEVMSHGPDDDSLKNAFQDCFCKDDESLGHLNKLKRISSISDQDRKSGSSSSQCQQKEKLSPQSGDLSAGEQDSPYDFIMKSKFFEEHKLPTSFKYDTIKMKHQVLSIPNQLGAERSNCPGKLVLPHHDPAHIKFTRLEKPANAFTDEHGDLDLGKVKSKIAKILEQISAPQQTSAVQQGAEGGVEKMDPPDLQQHSVDEKKTPVSEENILLTLRVRGIPTCDKNLTDLVLRLAKVMSCRNISKGDIREVSRLKPGSLVLNVVFKDMEKRDEFYLGRIELARERITTKHLGMAADSKIYVEETLSSEQLNLYRQAQERGRMRGYTCFTFRGETFVKKKDHPNKIKIDHPRDLNKIMQ